MIQQQISKDFQYLHKALGLHHRGGREGGTASPLFRAAQWLCQPVCILTPLESLWDFSTCSITSLVCFWTPHPWSSFQQLVFCPPTFFCPTSICIQAVSTPAPHHLSKWKRHQQLKLVESLLYFCTETKQSHKVMQPLRKTWIAIMSSKVIF